MNIPADAKAAFPFLNHRGSHETSGVIALLNAMASRFFLTSLVAVLVATFSSGCGRQAPTRQQSQDSYAQAPAPRDISAESRRSSGSLEQRRAELLNRIRAADPQQATIERALINERNELGLILNRQANLDDVPKLVKAMLAQMENSFPNQDHTVVAYAPTNPPRTIGTGHSNARTREMTYTPASR
jgi:hypothetical protein